MEIPNSKQQQLTFDKGITNVPSDAICSDNTLEECVGLTYDNGEHRVVQQPVTRLIPQQAEQGQPENQLPTLVFVHRHSDDVRYIGYEPGTMTGYYNVVWGTADSNGVFTPNATLLENISIDNLQVSAVGKTLIVSTTGVLCYFLWKDNGYIELDAIPAPKIQFALYDGNWEWMSATADDKASTIEIVNGDDGSIMTGKQSAYNDLVLGLYARNKRRAEKKMRFTRPFFARAAVEMYDGSYTKITNPVLLLPTFDNNSRVDYTDDGEWMTMKTFSCKLAYKQSQDYENFSDIVKGVVIFISEQIETLITDDDVPSIKVRTEGTTQEDGSHYTTYYYPSLNCASLSDGRHTWERQEEVAWWVSPQVGIGRFGSATNVCLPARREISSILSDLKDVSVFYKLGEAGRRGTNDFRDVSAITSDRVLSNLTTQTQLPVDDYYSHTRMTAGFQHVYNARLSIANVSRSFFEGFDFFVPYDNGSANGANYRTYVTIQTESGSSVIIRHSFTSRQRQGMWFYYPDSRATHVMIFKDNFGCILDAELKEHKGLNGAYYLADIDGYYGYTEQVVSGASEPQDVNNGDMEQLPNYVITSEVNNPFVFFSAGYTQVGYGSIIGLASQTMALGQEEHGTHPLTVFSSSGLYGMRLNNEGVYISSDIFSREICNNARSITETDGAVFFTSEKGLMVVMGRDVKCVSEQMRGRTSPGTTIEMPFHDFLKDAFIAYDYRDSLLWLFNSPTGFEEYCYLYNIKSGTFSTMNLGLAVTSVVNDYPDYLLQDEEKARSLLLRPDINLDFKTTPDGIKPNTYTATMRTRPMKLENAQALKSIIQVLHVKDFTPGPDADHQPAIALRVFASNNLRHWQELHSLLGMPWKYYKFQYDFTNLKATDRFGGSMVITQERRTDKLR